MKEYAKAGLVGGAAVVALLPISCGAEPAAFDPVNATITLERTTCFGPCPAYRVTIHGDGRVVFSSKADPIAPGHPRFAQSDGVLMPGTHEARIDRAAVTGLVEKFRSLHFWQMKPSYRAQLPDSPAVILTFDTGREKARVVDYLGRDVGMPKSVTELENAVDQVAGTDRWVSGSPALFPWLERTGFDFHSVQATELATAASLGNASEETVIGFIDRGVPLARNVAILSSVTPGPAGRPQIAGTVMLEAAIRRGQAQVFRRLSATGWLDRLGKGKAAEIFVENAGGCSAALVDAAADAGIDIDRPLARQSGVLGGTDQGKTALARLGDLYACLDRSEGAVRMAERLIARGANPNHRDALGRTPIYGVENLPLLMVLLRHGADARAKDNKGLSMAFGSWADAVVLTLLEAGASPVGQDDTNGNKTLAQLAKDRKMPRVAQWLATHPETYRR